jgi:trans-2,3-dihydro-3-hydroxyanthranilate isomerase
VVFDADTLREEQMRSLAARFGCETAFVLAPSAPGADLRLRYFVPQHEMEMCVHATVATTAVLVNRRRLTRSPARIETPLGSITVSWEGDRDGLWVTVEQFEPAFSACNPAQDEVAAALRIPTAAIDTSVGPIQVVSTSRAKLMVPLADAAILDSLRPDMEALWALCDRYAITGLYPFTICPRLPATDAEARQFPRRAGYDENPATGVAASALAAYLTEHRALGELAEGWHTYVVRQGYAMGRPSVLQAGAHVAHGRITRTQIRGQALIGAEERIELQP